VAEDGATPDGGTSEVLPLCGAFHALNDLRIDIDRRITSLFDDACRNVLWPELEPVLEKLDDVVDRLAKTQATHMAELQAKARVLATLLRFDDAGRSSVIHGDRAARLALSLAEDTASLAG
jgi:hypothetical protein